MWLKLSIAVCLLWLVHASHALPLTTDLSKKKGTSDATNDIVIKRAPSPQPSDDCRSSSSHIPDETMKPIVQPGDYIGFVNRAIQRAQKDNRRSSNGFPIIEGALKWLTRAQASMLSDATVINEIRDRYAVKMRRGSLSYARRERLREQLNKWTRFLSRPAHEGMQDLVYNAAALYEEDVKYLREQLRLLRDNGCYDLDMDPSVARAHLDQAREALRLWGGDLRSEDAIRMVRRELGLYVEAAQDCYEHTVETTDHAIKAIAWTMRLRNLQARGD